jgi:hypothetical protein
MFPRFQRAWLLAAALMFFPGADACRAQAPGATTGEATVEHVQKPAVAPRKSGAPVPPVPGQLTNSPSPKNSPQGHKRVPPILIAFVLLFLITWVRAYLERRRLRASFRQSCELPPE